MEEERGTRVGLTDRRHKHAGTGEVSGYFLQATFCRRRDGGERGGVWKVYPVTIEEKQGLQEGRQEV